MSKNASSNTPSSDPRSLLETHFHALADLNATERAAYFLQHEIEPDMRSKLDALLHADDSQETGIQKIITGEAKQATASDVVSGTLVGAYRITGKIADGGMGSVYFGERADGVFEQQVAIKLLRQTLLPNTDALERFRQERQVLAGLEHPGIARLLDGGTTEQGLPYLVMERIDGEVIDVYCRQRGLSVRQRLQLFISVCEAVQAAHQNLVVHRDIKPANILVDRSGQAKLLDFGIAKLLADEGADAETQFGQQAMTPEYASPEQVQGHRITTASDTYSLGVLLYQLLAEVSPYAHLRGQPLELQKAICTQEPARPSQCRPHVSKGKTRRADWQPLDADLDHIVLKAMRKEAAQRYSSPAEMANDIARYLKQQPVMARQGNWRYRTGKYVRRHTLALSATAVVLIAATALISFYTYRLSSERDFALQQQATAEQVSNFMVKLFDNADPERNNPEITAADMLKIGAQRVEQELANQPYVAAQLMLSMGEAYFSLGQFNDSLQVLDKALQLARSVVSSSPRLLIDVLMELGRVHYHLENWDQAETLLEEAVQRSDQTQGVESDAHLEALNTLIHMALRKHRRDPQLYEQLQWIIAQAQAQEPPHIGHLAKAYDSLSGWYKLNYRYQESLEATQITQQYDHQLHGEDSRQLLWHDENIGRVYWRLGDYRKAIATFQSSLNKQKKWKGPNSLESNWSWYFLALCQQAVGDYVAAKTSFETLLPIEERAQIYGNGRYLSRTLARYGDLLVDLGQYDAAGTHLERAESVLTAGLGADSVQHFHVQYGLARLYQAQGDWTRAIEHWRRYVQLRQRELAAEAPQLALAELFLANALRESGQMDEAAELIRSALPRLRSILGQQHAEFGIGLAIRARLLQAQGEQQAALNDFAAALTALPTLQRNDVLVADILDAYADLSLTEKNQALAKPLRKRRDDIHSAIAAAQ